MFAIYDTKNDIVRSHLGREADIIFMMAIKMHWENWFRFFWYEIISVDHCLLMNREGRRKKKKKNGKKLVVYRQRFFILLMNKSRMFS